MQTPLGSSHNRSTVDNVSEDYGGAGVHGRDVRRGLARAGISAKVFERTLDKVISMARSAPAKMEKKPLAVLGVGIGVGIAISAMLLPLVKLAAMRARRRDIHYYQRRIMRAFR